MAKRALSSVAKEPEMPTRVSVTLTPELHDEISAKAQGTGLSLNRTILQLVRAGLEAERQKRRHLETLLRQYRESSDPKEAERLGNELGAMLFGR